MKTENNILIAKFMGAYPVDIEDKEGFWYLIEGLFPHGYSKVMIGCSKYHSSWDWLMPTVNKCSQIAEDLNVESLFRAELWMFVTADIEAIYNAVIEFIKWYNENSAKKE